MGEWFRPAAQVCARHRCGLRAEREGGNGGHSRCGQRSHGRAVAYTEVEPTALRGSRKPPLWGPGRAQRDR